MRILGLLMGLLLIGDAEALAANTPLTMDAQTVDPGGADLFAPKPVDAPAVAAPSPAPRNDAATTAAAPPAEHIMSGNPLWEIPLARLSASRDQPLFAPSRRPAPPVEAVRAAPAPIGPPPKPPEPEKPQLSLLGTVAGSRERIGLFIETGSKEVVRLKAGENHQGWTLRNVRPRQVELAKGLDSTVLDLAPPDLKPGPAAPMLAGSLPGGPPPASVTKPLAGSSAPAGLVGAFKPSATAQAAPNSAVKRALEASQPAGSPSLQQRPH